MQQNDIIAHIHAHACIAKSISATFTTHTHACRHLYTTHAIYCMQTRIYHMHIRMYAECMCMHLLRAVSRTNMPTQWHMYDVHKLNIPMSCWCCPIGARTVRMGACGRELRYTTDATAQTVCVCVHTCHDIAMHWEATHANHVVSKNMHVLMTCLSFIHA